MARRALSGLILLAALAAVTDADAQRRRMPVRTDEIPDTESGRPAASAERPAFKGRMIIYGPPEVPFGAPPDSVKPAPKTEPVAEPKSEPAPAPSASPAPVAAPPPPVATPTPPPPAPVAVPIPTAPQPARIAAPTPAPTPPPAPASAAKPLGQEVALAAPSSAPAGPMAIETKLIESVFNCLSPGLPPDWKRAWVEITDQGGGKEKNSKFRVSNIRDVDDEGDPLVPCNAQELTRRIVSLNDKLPPDRRAWTRALLVIDSDGEYELSYEYAKK